ncbi:MAG: AbgT family transporter [Bacteroidales bacterium]|nr:AbgT family transporter [Bacteroidales bacterium]
MKPNRIPHTYVIVFAIALIATVMTWIIPAGEYNRIEQAGQTVIDPESYHLVEQAPQTWQLFSSFFQGFVNQSGIVMFILLIGGAFWILNASKSIDAGIMSFLNFTKRLEKKKALRKIGVNNIVMVLIMLMFSLFGAVFGMSEETIPFVVIMVPLAISMGYDSITGMCLVYVAAHIGFSGAILNPFTIGIAQQMSGLPLFSGIEYRIFCWLILNVIGFAIILWWASRVKKNPAASPMYQLDEYWRKNHDVTTMNIEYKRTKSSWVSFGIVLTVMVVCSIMFPVSAIKVGTQIFTIPAIPVGMALFAAFAIPGLLRSYHFYNLSLLFATIWFLIVGVMGYEWYVKEIGTLFFAMGLMAGIASGNTPNQITKLLLDGMKDILSAAMVVGLAGGIIVLLKDGKIIDTIMFDLSKAMNEMSKTASLGTMYLIQTCLNIIIPSGSAKAALTMPIMAPFSDLINISRQAMVMAFQFGDGFTNMITPTSGVLIGCLGMAKIPYDKWFKWVWKIILLFVFVGFLLLIPTVYMELNGF